MTAEPERTTSRQVVGAVVSADDGSVLLLRRKPGDFLAGLYELPSGQVEAGEKLEEALRREVLEETGLTVIEIRAHLPSFDYRSKSGQETRQFNYAVAIQGTAVMLTEHDDYRWVSSADVSGLNVSDQTRAILDSYWRTWESPTAP
jgi:8-oxo-dGTP diphosphatase